MAMIRELDVFNSAWWPFLGEETKGGDGDVLSSSNSSDSLSQAMASLLFDTKHALPIDFNQYYKIHDDFIHDRSSASFERPDSYDDNMNVAAQGFLGTTSVRSPNNYISSPDDGDSKFSRKVFTGGLSPEDGDSKFSRKVFDGLSPEDGDSKFSRKVFIGGLPPDMDDVSIHEAFSQFGRLEVDWPHKTNRLSYAFLVFENANSVALLLSMCTSHNGKYFVRLSSLTIADKLVQVRPWSSCDTKYNFDGKDTIGNRFTIFVGGVPRPTTARDLAMLMERVFGSVGYVAIEVDTEHHYPKGAARVSFTNREAFAAAVSKRHLTVRTNDHEKQVEMKPFLVEFALCDGCQVMSTRQFCGHLTCLKYLCDQCWMSHHWSIHAGLDHSPMIKSPAAPRLMRTPRRRYPMVAACI